MTVGIFSDVIQYVVKRGVSLQHMELEWDIYFICDGHLTIKNTIPKSVKFVEICD